MSKLIDKAYLASSYSLGDVLDVYAATKAVTGDAEMRQIVPKDVRGLDARVGVILYSTRDDRDRLTGTKKKRGRKSKAPASSS